MSYTQRDRIIHSRARFRRPAVRKVVRFYGQYTSMRGRTGHYQFRVKVSPNLSNKGIYKLIVQTQGRIKKGRSLPVHFGVTTFNSFAELHSSTWVRVRRVEYIDIKMSYSRRFGVR